MSLRTFSTRPLRLHQTFSAIKPHTSRHIRPFTYSRTVLYPRKESQDKDSIDTRASEYSKSGSDDAATHLDDTAFNSKVTSPEGQEEKAGQKEDGSYTPDNPLNVSPANKDVSQGRSPTEGGPEKGEGQKPSGGGSPSKGKQVR